MPKRSQNGSQLKFDQRLVLNQHLLALLGARSFDELARDLKGDPQLEALDDEGRTRFFQVLAAKLPEGSPITKEILQVYDENIVHHTRTISRRRQDLIRWKYFQYLSLLFTEMYLDRYFRDPQDLLRVLNERVSRFNEGKSEDDKLPAYQMDDLKKICFWMATGSGKTLIMHVNVLQYHHYLHRSRQGHELNRVILLTPNEGLSRQHLDELQASGFSRAELFQKDAQLRLPLVGDTPAVEIIDIHKLRETAGEKTVAIEAFEGNNLVLVDEGHLGASGEEWMDKRDRLCAEGFSFEYSATFGQAMKASKKKDLEDKYAKAVLFDYSYKYFYEDGYGKNYWILNLGEDGNEETHKLYLTACLLSFYQQQRIFRDRSDDLRPFNLDRPLWVFVGGSVSAVRTENKKKVSDVVEILLFLSEFVGDKKATITRLKKLLGGKSGILDDKKRDIFASAFPYLIELGPTPEATYAEVLKTFFNASAPGALHVELLKGTEGELALRIADNEPFGLINVGDAAALRKLCEEHEELQLAERMFSGSLFFGINQPDSSINLLIGSKKFTEGWNSYRVSTMGLLNVGKTEGPQIIQLFGRGVRLRGVNRNLKRSSHVPSVQPPKHLRMLETLNVFGVHANYMRQFREYLEEEGVPTEAEPDEFVLPTIKNLAYSHLKTVKLDESVDFVRDGPEVLLQGVPEALQRVPVRLNWYPRLQAQRSKELRDLNETGALEEGRLTEEHVSFLDLDELHWELERYKTERGYDKLTIFRGELAKTLTDTSWYNIFIPSAELNLDSHEKVRRIQDLATALTKRYLDRYYKAARAAWEREHLKLVTLTEADPNVQVEYTFLIEASKDEIVATLKKLKTAIEKGEMKDVEFGALHGILFGRHLYRPLVHLSSKGVSVTPVALNVGEKDFVLDLRAFFLANEAFFKDKELYLLRNLSRGKGIGFFENGNFYPDFILWLVVGGVQHIAFVDPKGIRNIDEDHPKIRFHETIKELEDRFAGEGVTFDSFILSTTPFVRIAHERKLTKGEFAERHVLFQVEDKETYARFILDTMMGSRPRGKPRH